VLLRRALFGWSAPSKTEAAEGLPEHVEPQEGETFASAATSGKGTVSAELDLGISERDG
jgi:hypothetical protein